MKHNQGGAKLSYVLFGLLCWDSQLGSNWANAMPL